MKKLIILLIITLFIISGCISEVDKGTLTVRGKWPDRATRLIPIETTRIDITIDGINLPSGTFSDSQSIKRSSGTDEFQYSWENMQEGDYAVNIVCIDDNNTQYNIVAEINQKITVKKGENVLDVAVGRPKAVSEISFPLNNSTIIPELLTNLKWISVGSTILTQTSGNYNEISYDVYFGTDISNMKKINQTSIVEPSANIPIELNTGLPTIEANKKYYWKIVATNSIGESTSEIFSFNTIKGKSMIYVEKGQVSLPTAVIIPMNNAYFISPAETTQKEFETEMGFNPSDIKGDNYPVYNISTYDAMMYCNKLSEKEGLNPYYEILNISYNGIAEKSNIISATVNKMGGNGYRLPTTLEWDYAIYGGGNTPTIFDYSGSDNINDVAWYFDNSNYLIHEVMQKKPNFLGIYDMTGNVSEISVDDSQTSPIFYRNGGSYNNVPDAMMNGMSGIIINMDYSSPEIGFRVVRTK